MIAMRLMSCALRLLASSAAAPAFAAPPDNCDRCFAVIRGNGTVVKQRNVPAVDKTEKGQYFLVFGYSVNKSALMASIDSGVVDGNIRPGMISINRANNTGVRTSIYAPTGGGVIPADFPFSILATC